MTHMKKTKQNRIMKEERKERKKLQIQWKMEQKKQDKIKCYFMENFMQIRILET